MNAPRVYRFVWYVPVGMRKLTEDRRRQARWVAGIVLSALLFGCAPRPWTAEQLATRHPELASHAGQRLVDVRPYYLPQRDQLTLFLCRWPTDQPIPVVIAGEATAEERRAVQVALAAWENAGIGVRFERPPALADRGIEIVFATGILSWTASTVSQCVMEPGASARSVAPGGAVDARMRAASIQLGRNDPRLVGSILHELGHALGFQGHPSRGDSIMRRDATALLEASVRVGKGGEFQDSTVAALYAVPSGTVLARLPVPPQRTAQLDVVAARAAAEGWKGPFLQVGDNAGRVGWRTPSGERLNFRLTGLRAALEKADRLMIEAEAPTVLWLERQR